MYPVRVTRERFPRFSLEISRRRRSPQRQGKNGQRRRKNRVRGRVKGTWEGLIMGDKSKIEWTDATWNPVTGCSKVDQGCKNCYAERLFPKNYPGRKFADVRVHED